MACDQGAGERPGTACAPVVVTPGSAATTFNKERSLKPHRAAVRADRFPLAGSAIA